jgi:hypothetical protein
MLSRPPHLRPRCHRRRTEVRARFRARRNSTKAAGFHRAWKSSPSRPAPFAACRARLVSCLTSLRNERIHFRHA